MASSAADVAQVTEKSYGMASSVAAVAQGSHGVPSYLTEVSQHAAGFSTGDAARDAAAQTLGKAGTRLPPAQWWRQGRRSSRGITGAGRSGPEPPGGVRASNSSQRRERGFPSS